MNFEAMRVAFEHAARPDTAGIQFDAEHGSYYAPWNGERQAQWKIDRAEKVSAMFRGYCLGASALPVEDEVEVFLSEVRAELMRARTKFPGDRIMTIALAEEFGELCKAVLDESAANVRKEAVQTSVMCARLVLDGDGSVREWRAERGLDQLVQPSAGGDHEQ